MLKFLTRDFRDFAKNPISTNILNSSWKNSNESHRQPVISLHDSSPGVRSVAIRKFKFTES